MATIAQRQACRRWDNYLPARSIFPKGNHSYQLEQIDVDVNRHVSYSNLNKPLRVCSLPETIVFHRLKA